MKFIPIFTFVTILLFVSTQSIGQVKVLVNEVATDVDTTNGKLTAFYKQYPNFMNGYEKAPFDPFKKVLPRLNELDYVDTDVPNPNVIPKVSKSTSAANSSTSSKKAIKEDKFVYFIGNTLRLKKNSLSEVAAFSDQITKGKSKSILIKGWYKVDDILSQKLVKDRLEACKSKLEQNGVPSNLILISILESNTEKRQLSMILQ